MEVIKKNSTKLVFTSVIALVCSWAIIGNAGNLNPSAPPAPTMHTLEEIYNEVVNLSADPRIPVQSLSGSGTALYVISQSGSYYLTDNISTIETDKHGIEVTANDVTIDLNGYSLIGPGKTVGSTGRGISSGPERTTVKNGSIVGWRGEGVYLSGYGGQVSNLKVTDCGATGVWVQMGTVVKNCTATSNNGPGIHAYGGNCVISECTAQSNTNIGIKAGENCTVDRCTARNNGGLAGIYADNGTVVEGSSSQWNTADGFRVYVGSVVKNCTASFNGSDGIDAEYSVISNCSAYDNSSDGIDAENCLIVENASCSNDATNLNLTSCTSVNNHTAP